MNSFNVENIREEIIDCLMPLWKNYSILAERVAEYSKGASILLEWMTACVEYKVKKSTLNGLKKTEVEVIAGFANRVSICFAVAGKAQRPNRFTCREE